MPDLDPAHVEAVARVLMAPRMFSNGSGDKQRYNAAAILTSTDPAVHEALAAALVRADLGEVEWRVAGMDAPKYDRTSSDYPEREYVEHLQRRRGGRIQRRYVTRWEEV